jgi:putative nucleotidyltransferase with HDIG domain
MLDSSGSFLSVRASLGQCTGLKGSFPVADSVLGLPLRLGHLVIADEDDIETFAQLSGVQDLRALTLSPLSTSAGQIGVLVLGRKQPASFSAADLDLLIILNDVASTAIHRVRLREELEEAFVGATLALAEAVDAKDSYVAGHAQRTGDLAERVARHLGLPDDEVEAIRYGAILHDVGKISVPDSILRKTGPLSSEEWNVMHRHTIAGARILAPVARLSRAAQVVRHHHERWDGTGYPGGLRGEEIPLGARIVAVVDAYTAMIDERTYRKALTYEEALHELQRHAGTQFDPAVVEAFLRVTSDIEFQH